MIELRWLNIKHEEWVEGSNTPKYTHERVLQFRAEEGPFGEEWWGDWKEIPEEYEER